MVEETEAEMEQRLQQAPGYPEEGKGREKTGRLRPRSFPPKNKHCRSHEESK